jgi:hypothetical protein
MTVAITGPREAIEWVLVQDRIPNAERHDRYGLFWIEAPDLDPDVEFDVECGGCKVHHIQTLTH